jgi:hypothetical protein
MVSTEVPSVQFSLVRVWNASKQEGCQACGHAINVRYDLSDGNGRFLTVGSECAVSLCWLSPKPCSSAVIGQPANG